MSICLNIIEIFVSMDFSINKLVFLIFFAITFSLSAHNRNVAKDAEITVSSFLNADKSPENLVDGIIGVHNLGEWACKGERTSWGYIELPWIRMEWEKPQTVNRIVIYDIWF